MITLSEMVDLVLLGLMLAAVVVAVGGMWVSRVLGLGKEDDHE